MIASQSVFHHFSSLAGRLVAAGLIAVVWSTTAPRAAQAQLDMQTLIGSDVTEVGPKYQDIDKAITRFKNTDFRGARTILRDVVSKNSELPPANVLMAKMYFSVNQPAAGLAALERAAAEHPRDPESYLILGDLALRDGHFAASGALLARAAELNTSLTGNEKRKRNIRVRALNGRAMVAERREQWQDVEKYLRQLIREEPEGASFYQRLGRAFFMLGNHEYAEKAFLKAKDLDPKVRNPHVTQARLFHQTGDEAEAKAQFEMALKEGADDVAVRLAYAQWLIESDQPDQARSHIEFAIQSEPELLDALLLAGILARETGDPKTAEVHFGQAHLLAPANATVTNQLARALVDQNDEAKRRRAAEFALLALGQAPNNGDLGVTLGWIYYKMGQTAGAEQRLNAALKSRTLSPDSRYLVAQLLFDRGRNQDAKQLLEPALKMPGIFIHRREAQALLDRMP